jgi:small subunit ribosomal protein S24e
MADNAVTLRTRKFIRNPMLNRRQMVVDVLHPNRANVKKQDLKEKLAKQMNAKDANAVVLFGFRTAFGGGKSTGFACVYDSVEDAKKYHVSKHHLWRMELIEKTEKKGRKGIKEAKNRGKKVRGVGRRIAKKKAKRSAE